jgi:hypothetical protein
MNTTSALLEIISSVPESLECSKDRPDSHRLKSHIARVHYDSYDINPALIPLIIAAFDAQDKIEELDIALEMKHESVKERYELDREIHLFHVRAVALLNFVGGVLSEFMILNDLQPSQKYILHKGWRFSPDYDNSELPTDSDIDESHSQNIDDTSGAGNIRH